MKTPRSARLVRGRKEAAKSRLFHLVAPALAGVGGCAFLLAACRGNLEPARRFVRDRFQSKLERGFSAEEQRLLATDFESFAQHRLALDADREYGPMMRALFGGPGTSGASGSVGTLSILRFLDERVRYLYPPFSDPRVDFQKRDRERQVGAGMAAGRSAKAAQSRPLTLATNLSAPLWFAHVQRPTASSSIRFNGQSIAVRSARLGAIRLEAPYFALAGTGRYTPLYRVATLVHEARHSDCPGGLDAEDVRRIRSHAYPANRACGHAHSACPATIPLPSGGFEPHPYAGALACDAVPWGAYAVQAAFALGFARDCRDCTEAERQEMQMLAIDSMLRVGEKATALMRGELGPPDLSSSARAEGL